MHVCSETQLGVWSVAEMFRTGPGACKLRLTATNYSQLNAFNSWKDAHSTMESLPKTKCIYESAEGSGCIVFPHFQCRVVVPSLPLLANSNTIPLPSFLPPFLSSFSIFPPPPSGARESELPPGGDCCLSHTEILRRDVAFLGAQAPHVAPSRAR